MPSHNLPQPSNGTEMYLAVVVEHLDEIRGELVELRGLLSTRDSADQAPEAPPGEQIPLRLTEPLPPPAAKAAPKKTSGPRRNR